VCSFTFQQNTFLLLFKCNIRHGLIIKIYIFIDPIDRRWNIKKELFKVMLNTFFRLIIDMTVRTMMIKIKQLITDIVLVLSIHVY